MPENESGFVPALTEDEKAAAEFSKYLPGSIIRNAELSTLPAAALARAEEKSSLLINSADYRPGNFETAQVISHPDGSKTYVVTQTKTYGAGSKHTEELSYFLDTVGDQLMGSGELRKAITNQVEYFKDKPFVGSTRNEESGKGKFLGARRLEIMNAFSQMKYGLPLYSDTRMSPLAIDVWEGFVQSGKATKFKEGPNDRYVFKKAELLK